MENTTVGEYLLEQVHNLHLEIFPVLHFMIYIHACEMVVLSNKHNQNL